MKTIINALTGVAATTSEVLVIADPNTLSATTRAMLARALHLDPENRCIATVQAWPVASQLDEVRIVGEDPNGTRWEAVEDNPDEWSAPEHAYKGTPHKLWIAVVDDDGNETLLETDFAVPRRWRETVHSATVHALPGRGLDIETLTVLLDATFQQWNQELAAESLEDDLAMEHREASHLRALRALAANRAQGDRAVLEAIANTHMAGAVTGDSERFIIDIDTGMGPMDKTEISARGPMSAFEEAKAALARYSVEQEERENAKIGEIATLRDLLARASTRAQTPTP